MIQLPGNLDDLLRRDRLGVVDVGARGGWPQKWRDLRPWVTFIGFEPEAAECERLRSTAARNEIYICEALYRSESAVVLHHTRDPHCSSVYRPNEELIRRLRPNDTSLDVVRSEHIVATTLDKALEKGESPSVDFIKLDTQGSELDILLGGGQTLERVIGVEVEVEFMPLYQGQPLFADVHHFLQSKGFALMDFPHTCSVADFAAAVRPPPSSFLRRAVSSWNAGMKAPRGKYRGARQLLYADAIYLRDVDFMVDWIADDTDNSRTLAVKFVVVCCATGYYEHALSFIELGRDRGLISGEASHELHRMLRTLSNSMPRLVGDLKRFARRLVQRYSHPGR